MDAIDRLAMNARLHHLGSAARIREPMQKLAVLTCMDARIDVERLLGLQPGDAHVIRNAGGRATADAIRSLALSQAAMGTREVMVIHHTDCAIGRVKQEELARLIAEATGHACEQDFGCFDDPIEAIAEDVRRLRSDPSLAHRDRIRGFLYDLSSNTLSEPTPPPQ
jgi:carbonic anhydrase